MDNPVGFGGFGLGVPVEGVMEVVLNFENPSGQWVRWSPSAGVDRINKETSGSQQGQRWWCGPRGFTEYTTLFII